MIAVAIAFALLSSAAAQRGPATNPCVPAPAPGTPTVEPVLRPVDEASRRPDFAVFRRRLEDDVARRDEAAVLAIVHPNVRTSFGDGGGIEAFKKELECLAVIGSTVRVRAAPGLNARIITALDFAIVRARPAGGSETPGWRRVQLADGQTGYMASRYVRSPIDHRALFAFEEGRWRLMAYVAGD